MQVWSGRQIRKVYANCSRAQRNKNRFLDAQKILLTGQIRERDWFGPSGMEHVRTVKQPKQAIPTFVETVALLMKVSTA